jgi:hypothetical protein
MNAVKIPWIQYFAIDPLGHVLREDAMLNRIRNSIFERQSKTLKVLRLSLQPGLDRFSAVDHDEVHLGPLSILSVSKRAPFSLTVRSTWSTFPLVLSVSILIGEANRPQRLILSF